MDFGIKSLVISLILILVIVRSGVFNYINRVDIRIDQTIE
jgi:hypothetical protein